MSLKTRWIVSAGLATGALLILSSGAQAGVFTVSGALTDDASTGISSSKTYTHTVSGGIAASINGVSFDVLNSSNTPADFDWNTNGFRKSQIPPPSSDPNNDWIPEAGGVTGTDLIDMLESFTFSANGDGNPASQTFTLSSLSPGTTYDARLYIRMWDTTGSGRPIDLTFTNGTEVDLTSVHQDRPSLVGLPNDQSAYYLNYQYTAQTSDLVIDALVVEPDPSGSFHLYALSNEVVPQTMEMNGGWEAILPPGLEDYVDVVDNGTDLIDGDLVNFLTITADFTQGPSNGRFPSIPIAFQQTHENAAEYLVIEEQINFNSSGADWDGFEFTLAGGGDPVFDLAKTEASGGPAPIGYSVAPFTSAQFTDDNTRLAITAGRVDDGDVWFPGSGENDGQLWIDVTPGPNGDFTNFSFLQRPAAVPEPGTISMLAVGMAIILLLRSPK